MKCLCACLFAILFAGVTLAFAGSAGKEPTPTAQGSLSAADETSERLMVEGEIRFRTNCSRCHQSPHKFPPRAMAMAVRHMRVRAILTDDDMKYVLYYMTH